MKKDEEQKYLKQINIKFLEQLKVTRDAIKALVDTVHYEIEKQQAYLYIETHYSNFKLKNIFKVLRTLYFIFKFKRSKRRLLNNLESIVMIRLKMRVDIFKQQYFKREVKALISDYDKAILHHDLANIEKEWLFKNINN